jgi:uncharacterized membrane protein YeaQ/YmgE (transglycosylase-associated protein family)
VELLRLALLGLAVGVVARLATHGRGRVGVGPGMAIGIVGSVAGGLLARLFGIEGGAVWVIAAAVALVLLGAARVIRTAGSRRTS